MELKKLLCHCIVLVVLSAVSAMPQQKMRIAIMNMTGQGVSANITYSVSELMRTEMFNTGMFRVVEREQMDKIMKEAELQASGCTDTECAVKLGKIMSVDRMLVGSIVKIGTKLIINARIINIERGEMELADKVSADSENDLDSAVSRFAVSIANRIRGGGMTATATPTAVTTASKVKLPTGMQPNAFKSILFWSGVSIAGAGALCNGFGVIEKYIIAPAALTAYNDLPSGTAESVFTAKYNDYMGANNLGSTMNIIGVICYGVGASAFVVSLFLPEYIPVQAYIYPKDGGAEIQFAYRF